MYRQASTARTLLPTSLLFLGLFLLPLPGLGQLLGKKNASSAVPFTVLSQDKAFLGTYRREVKEDFATLAAQGKPYYLSLSYQAQVLAITDSQSTYQLPQGYMLLRISVGEKPSTAFGLSVLKVEEDPARKLLHVYYTLGEASATSTEPLLWLLVPKSAYQLQFWQVPWQRQTKKGNTETVYDYKHADGIVYTEYHPLAIDVEVQEKPDGGK